MSKDIFVIVEQRNGVVQKVTKELIGESVKLAGDLGEEVVAVLMGYNIKGEAEQLIHYGASKVLVLGQPVLENYTTEPNLQGIGSDIHHYAPTDVLFGASTCGRDRPPPLAGRVHTGLTADCTRLDVKVENYQQYLLTSTSMSLQPEKVAAHDKSDRIQKITRPPIGPHDPKVLVSGGRGVGGSEGYNPLRALAAELGGEVSSSRIGVDSGWIEKSRQVGQTGKTVHPNLYIACGISGAIQHLAGMESSEFIVAINKDDQCPMMNIADLGVQGDLKVIVPMLTEAVKAYKAKQNAI